MANTCLSSLSPLPPASTENIDVPRTGCSLPWYPIGPFLRNTRGNSPDTGLSADSERAVVGRSGCPMMTSAVTIRNRSMFTGPACGSSRSQASDLFSIVNSTPCFKSSPRQIASLKSWA